MWYLVLLPFILTGDEDIGPGAVYYELSMCQESAKKWNSSRQALKWQTDEYVCLHSTSHILRSRS